MATSIIPDPRPLFLQKTYTCGTGTIYPITDTGHSARKSISKSALGITVPTGYTMAGIKSYKCYDDNITVTKADPKNDYEVLWLLNFNSWNISTTAQITIIWVRSDRAAAG